jgi:hypothetical protein
MITGAIQTYVVMQKRVAIFADCEMRRFADAATRYLPRGATFSGQPTGKNNTVHLTDGSGFIPADAVAPCFRYAVRDIIRVLEVPQPDAFQAQGGTAFKRPGEQFDAAMVAPGWLWITSGVGYIPEAAAQVVGVTQPTHPSGARAANRIETDVVQDDHNLSLCVATFCDGDLSRYLELYNLVVSSPSEKPNNNKRVFLTSRGWLVGIFQNLRHAAQH